MPRYEIAFRVKDELVVVSLADDCDVCAGDGRFSDGSTCENCDGVGYLLTSNGAQILAMVNDMNERNERRKEAL